MKLSKKQKKRQRSGPGGLAINRDGFVIGGKISKEDMKKMLDRLQRKNKKFMN